jgi:CRISPR-associated protein Cmr3
MGSAIQLANYYLNQVRVIHAEGDSEGTLEDSCSRIIKISQRKGWISARDVHAADRAIRKRLPTESVRSLFRELEAMGLGETSGEGVHLEFAPILLTFPLTTC